MPDLPQRVGEEEFDLLRSLTPELERLDPDDEASSPRPRAEVYEYACLEGIGFTEDVEDGADDNYFVLTFLRTAKIEDRKYWIWSAICSEDDLDAYVLLEESDRYPGTITGLRVNDEKLTPEQFIWGDFCNVYGDVE